MEGCNPLGLEVIDPHCQGPTPFLVHSGEHLWPSWHIRAGQADTQHRKPAAASRCPTPMPKRTLYSSQVQQVPLCTGKTARGSGIMKSLGFGPTHLPLEGQNTEPAIRALRTAGRVGGSATLLLSPRKIF